MSVLSHSKYHPLIRPTRRSVPFCCYSVSHFFDGVEELSGVWSSVCVKHFMKQHSHEKLGVGEGKIKKQPLEVCKM